MGKTDARHELAIADNSGNEIGLTLVKDRGVPQYVETFDYAQAVQFFNGDLSYGRFDATRRITIAQQNYQAGFGKEYAGGTPRYHTGTNIDARFENEVRAGPLAEDVTKPATPSSGRSDGSGNGTWATVASVYDEDLTTSSTTSFVDPWGWSDYLELTYTAHDATNILIYLNRTHDTIDDIEIGVEYGSAWYIIEDDPSNITWNAWNTIAIGSEQSITKIRVKLNFDGTGPQPTVTIYQFSTDRGASIGAVTDMVEFNSKYYLAAGVNIWKLEENNGRGLILIKNDIGATITDLHTANISGTDYLFIMLGWGADYYYMIADETFAQTNITNAELKFMVTDGTTFRGVNTNSTIVSTTAPLQSGTNWATEKQIGEDAYDIVDLIMFEGLPYIKKSDCRVYYLDSSNNVQVLISSQANIGGTNISRMYVHRKEALIIPWGEQDLIHYDGSTITYISPALFMNNATDFSGQIQAVTGDGFCLYIVMKDGADVQIMSSKIGATASDWGWHPLKTLTITNCASAHISSIYKKRMWIGSDTAGEALNYIPITTQYGDIGNDSNYAYQTGGSIETSWQTVDLPEDTKAWLKLTLRMADTTSAIYWRAYYKVLGGSWIEISSTNKFKVSPQTSAFIGSGSTSVTSTMMKLKFEPVTNSTSSTPLLLGWKLEALWYATEQKLIALTVRVEDNLQNVLGQTDDVLGSTIRSTLDNINSSKWPRAFYPPYWKKDDPVLYVKKLPLPAGRGQLELRKIEGGDKDKLEYVYNLLLEKIDVE